MRSPAGLEVVVVAVVVEFVAVEVEDVDVLVVVDVVEFVGSEVVLDELVEVDVENLVVVGVLVVL